MQESMESMIALSCQSTFPSWKRGPTDFLNKKSYLPDDLDIFEIREKILNSTDEQ